MVADGQFQEDVYFRLLAFPVTTLSLRERREDLPLLAAYFIERRAAHLGRPVTPLRPEALDSCRPTTGRGTSASWSTWSSEP